MEDIRNVLIFVSDSLRWEYLPDEFVSNGVRLKTVAQAPHSAPSFATLSTGVYPSQHGVRHFGQMPADDADLIYDLNGINGMFFNEGRYRNDPLYRMFDIDDPRQLVDLDSPFLFLERDTTTHAPYVKNGFLDNINVRSYFTESGYNWERLRSEYRGVVTESLDLFKRRLQALKRLGVRDETLVVLTADHGELFGEYGELLHTAPLCPELIYVPTVFFHPDLEADDFSVNQESEIVEHVDIVETCLNAIGCANEISTEGTDLLSDSRPRDFGYSEVKLERNGMTFYEADGVWWRDSGLVETLVSKPHRAFYMLYKMLRSPGREYLRSNWRVLLETYLNDSHTYNTTGVESQPAESTLEEFRESIETRGGRDVALDESTESALKDLGYMR